MGFKKLFHSKSQSSFTKSKMSRLFGIGGSNNSKPDEFEYVLKLKVTTSPERIEKIKHDINNYHNLVLFHKFKENPKQQFFKTSNLFDKSNKGILIVLSENAGLSTNIYGRFFPETIELIQKNIPEVYWVENYNSEDLNEKILSTSDDSDEIKIFT